jgi:hypothetical protein
MVKVINLNKVITNFLIVKQLPMQKHCSKVHYPTLITLDHVKHQRTWILKIQKLKKWKLNFQINMIGENNTLNVYKLQLILEVIEIVHLHMHSQLYQSFKIEFAKQTIIPYN